MEYLARLEKRYKLFHWLVNQPDVIYDTTPNKIWAPQQIWECLVKVTTVGYCCFQLPKLIDFLPCIFSYTHSYNCRTTWMSACSVDKGYNATKNTKLYWDFIGNRTTHAIHHLIEVILALANDIVLHHM